jgi:hypothetical protein
MQGSNARADAAIADSGVLPRCLGDCGGSPMHKIVLAAAIALAAITAAPAKSANVSILDKIVGPKAVDFTFSLECRTLESNYGQTIHYQTYTAVELFEQQHGSTNWYHRPYEGPTHDGVQDYYPAGRIAFNHGEPDGSSLPAVEGLRVVEVTPEEVVLRGRTTLGSANGRFDRRTGHGEINEYKKYYDRREFKGEPWIGGEEGEDIWQQWIFECKPSAPAKF